MFSWCCRADHRRSCLLHALFSLPPLFLTPISHSFHSLLDWVITRRSRDDYFYFRVKIFNCQKKSLTISFEQQQQLWVAVIRRSSEWITGFHALLSQLCCVCSVLPQLPYSSLILLFWSLLSSFSELSFHAPASPETLSSLFLLSCLLLQIVIMHRLLCNVCVCVLVLSCNGFSMHHSISVSPTDPLHTFVSHPLVSWSSYQLRRQMAWLDGRNINNKRCDQLLNGESIRLQTDRLFTCFAQHPTRYCIPFPLFHFVGWVKAASVPGCSVSVTSLSSPLILFHINIVRRSLFSLFGEEKRTLISEGELISEKEQWSSFRMGVTGGGRERNLCLESAWRQTGKRVHDDDDDDESEEEKRHSERREKCMQVKHR